MRLPELPESKPECDRPMIFSPGDAIEHSPRKACLHNSAPLPSQYSPLGSRNKILNLTRAKASPRREAMLAGWVWQEPDLSQW